MSKEIFLIKASIKKNEKNDSLGLGAAFRPRLKKGREK